MSDEADPNFEIALAELEKIVASLERGEPELTSALSKYENGVQLLSICHRILEKAERSVALLTGVDDQGNALTAPFDSKATMPTEAITTVEVKTVEVTVEVTEPTATQSKRKVAEKPVTRRSRIAPADPTADPNDPPF
jgi:exodeoxyribonuclease VII small subunit